MADKLTHWKKLVNPDYLGCYSLPVEKGKSVDLILTIDKIVREQVKSEGGKSEECTIAYFKEKVKPMILNRTNCKMITRLYDTAYIEQWAGLKIIVGQSTTRLKGEDVECLRIRDQKPNNTLPEIQIDDKENFDKCKKAIQNGYTIEKIRTKWSVSPEVEKALLQ